MSWMDRVSALLTRKSSRAGAAVAAIGLAPARWTPRRYDRLAEEGYRRNVVAYRCVREVARASASVPWFLYKGEREFDTHPLLDLLRRPNPRQSGPELIEAAIGHLLLSGNAYLEVVRPDGEAPRELYALRPDRMRIVPDVSGVPRAYRYEVEGRSVDWPVDPISGASDVLHLRDFHPLDEWYGLSPIEAAAAAIDQHNAAAEHNAALLQNGARPSGALVFRADPGPDGIRRVEEALLDRTQGPRQAGRPLVLGGDVDWKELGFSPKDMDFAELKAQAAREIAAAFGVPHLLVVAGEATFNNRADARLELWEHTVIPLLDRLSSALSTWLGPMFGQDLRLAHDLDEVPALAPRRRLKWQQIQAADFLNELSSDTRIDMILTMSRRIAATRPDDREVQRSVLGLLKRRLPRDDWSVRRNYLTVDFFAFVDGAIKRESDLEEAKAMVIEEPQILRGTPVIRGTRIPVYDVAASLTAELPLDRIRKAYPQLDDRMIELSGIYAKAWPMRGRPHVEPLPRARIVAENRISRRRRT